ncbi:50S ribosomal protein L28 [Oligoflexia bacterium]|nr:50S ribosomal protein L28 [Oligoflexia bacterium]
MAHRCKISGVSRQTGNRVSHAKNRTRHVFKANIQSRRIFIPSEKRHIKLKLSTRMMRTIDKLGFENTLKKYNLTLKDLKS